MFPLPQVIEAVVSNTAPCPEALVATPLSHTVLPNGTVVYTYHCHTHELTWRSWSTAFVISGAVVLMARGYSPDLVMLSALMTLYITTVISFDIGGSPVVCVPMGTCERDCV